MTEYFRLWHREQQSVVQNPVVSVPHHPPLQRREGINCFAKGIASRGIKASEEAVQGSLSPCYCLCWYLLRCIWVLWLHSALKELNAIQMEACEITDWKYDTQMIGVSRKP